MAKKKRTKKTANKKTHRTRRSKHPEGLKDPLLFVDTNIFLDFYRARNEQELALLDRLESVGDRIICTYQVEMEFKKNRQLAILETLKLMTFDAGITIPSFLMKSAAAKTVRNRLSEVKTRIEDLRSRVQEVLHKPTARDPVYKVAQRLFKAQSPHNLNRCNVDLYEERRHEIRALAEKRHTLGYPPRKDKTTSLGDAVNWEWIVACAELEKRDVLIVSRDRDYGETVGGESYINDWLLTEFRSRVNAHGQVRLTQRLSAALEWLKEPVSEEEVQAEEALIHESEVAPTRRRPATIGALVESMRRTDPLRGIELRVKAMEEFERLVMGHHLAAERAFQQMVEQRDPIEDAMRTVDSVDELERLGH